MAKKKTTFISDNPYKYIGELGIQFKPEKIKEDGEEVNSDYGIYKTSNDKIKEYFAQLNDVRKARK